MLRILKQRMQNRSLRLTSERAGSVRRIGHGEKRMEKTKQTKSRITRHNKYGYIFLIPFMAAFVVFQMIPLVSTVFNSFFENYKSGLKQIGPNFVGFGNYIKLISSGDLLKYFGNTMIMWILGFIPQIVVSLLLSAWFTDPSLRLKGQRFFKTVIYLPNLIMASAFAMLFFTLFGDNGPVNSILVQAGIFSKPYSFMSHIGSVRGLVAFMNFLMWFGNTTILLMAGMMGIDQSDLCHDHVADRRTADVRCTADSDKRIRRPDALLNDADYVPE